MSVDLTKIPNIEHSPCLHHGCERGEPAECLKTGCVARSFDSFKGQDPSTDHQQAFQSQNGAKTGQKAGFDPQSVDVPLPMVGSGFEGMTGDIAAHAPTVETDDD